MSFFHDNRFAVRIGLSIFSIAASLGCVERLPTGPASSKPSNPVTPIMSLQIVEVTTVTTGVDLDPDGYGVLNDEWDYDVGDGNTVPVGTNDKVILTLRPGPHALSLVGVAKNCSGADLDDRPVVVASGNVVTKVVFEVVCRA